MCTLDGHYEKRHNHRDRTIEAKSQNQRFSPDGYLFSPNGMNHMFISTSSTDDAMSVERLLEFDGNVALSDWDDSNSISSRVIVCLAPWMVEVLQQTSDRRCSDMNSFFRGNILLIIG